VSGVNLDEEMTNMLQFQHGYQAAAKMVTTINDMLDSIINMVR
jgi:flagellar hook-associated protein 1 FlgK